MLHIGCHLSVAKGYAHMGKDARQIDASTFQFFSRNPRGSKVKQLDPADMEALRVFLESHQFAPLLIHAPYTMNPCSKDPQLRKLAADMMQEDLERLQALPGQFYTFHPGSHVGQGIEAGISMIADVLNQVLSKNLRTTVLLEGMSGKGSEVGGRFEELRAILDQTELGSSMGVCVDTCHLYAAGYDIVQDLDGVLAQFDQIIGLDRLKAVHLNDSMTELGSHKDRHAKIGEGQIGTDAISAVINHEKLRHLPFYLETPNELDGYAAEIKLLRSLYTS